MKKILFALIMMAASTALAKKKPETLAEVYFKGKDIQHKYTLLKTGKTPVFKLVFYENKNKPREKVLSKSQANSIKGEATRIVWNSLYRKPASLKKCTPYASVVSGSDKADVCREDAKQTGPTFGLLNTLRSMF